jgi:hypothetical protein
LKKAQECRSARRETRFNEMIDTATVRTAAGTQQKVFEITKNKALTSFCSDEFVNLNTDLQLGPGLECPGWPKELVPPGDAKGEDGAPPCA